MQLARLKRMVHVEDEASLAVEASARRLGDASGQVFCVGPLAGPRCCACGGLRAGGVRRLDVADARESAERALSDRQ
eukprot:3947552-Prymnesium_polylepis.1